MSRKKNVTDGDISLMSNKPDTADVAQTPGTETDTSGDITADKTGGATEPQDTAQEPKLYVGPSIIPGATTGTVYSAIPERMKALRSEIPDIMSLFINVGDYSKAENMIRGKTGYVYRAYRHAEEYLEKRRNNK